MTRTTAGTAGPVVTTRALGRATLARQLLLRRERRDVADVVRSLVGLQAQVPAVPYLALWSRLDGFVPEDLAGPMRRRELVRAPLLRTTIHTVTAADALGLRPLVQPVLERTFASTAWGQRLRGHDLTDAFAVAVRLVEERPRTRAELARLLADAVPGPDPVSLSWAFSYHVPLVQPTPRGLWGESGPSALTTYRAWVGADAEPGATTLDEVVLRYLRVFGPASVRDVQAWCGLTRLREVVDRLGDRVRHLRGEDGQALVDVPDGLLPDPDKPAPVRFLPEYDNALLSYADRSRVVHPAPHEPLLGGPGGLVGSVLVDGLVRATWALRRERGTAALEVRRSTPLTPVEADDVEAEGRVLLRFVAPDEDHAVAFTGAG